MATYMNAFSYFLVPGMKESNEAKLNLLYLEQSKQSSHIQNGQASFLYSQGSENCHRVYFSPMMSAVPSIKLTPKVSNTSQKVEAIFNTWLRNVSQSYFTYCVREIIPYGGLHSGQVNWVAVSHFLSDNSSIIENYHIDIPKGDHCIKQVLHQRYMKDPVVLVTAESMVDSGDEPLAWVEEADDNRIEV